MFLRTLALGITLAAAAPAVQAATILDTLSPNPAPFDFATNQGGIRFFNIGFVGPFGQSFTLTETAEDLRISAFLSTFDTSANVTASLVEGAGFSIAALGADNVSITGIDRFDAVLATFDFSDLGALAAGTYTILFSGSGALGAGEVLVTSPGVYVGVDTAGTDAYLQSGLYDFDGNPARDFGILVEGEPTAVVPLPATGLLLIGGLAAMGMMRRRRS